MTSPRLIRLDEGTHLAAADSVPSALVVGNFDGVHRGHLAVLAQAVLRAGELQNVSVCALTFDPHPAQIIGPGALPLLTSLEDRVSLLCEAGVGRVYARSFDVAFASWSAERFAAELVGDVLRAKVVVVGGNFRFGVNRTGDVALLRRVGRERGFEVHVPDVASDERGPYSSTRARDAVIAGDLDEARRVLGRPHAVTGSVVHGDARGRTLGFPTANLDDIPQVLPPNGVYAVRVDRRDETAGGYVSLALGLANVGVRPTIGGDKRTVEAHLLDISSDLYGARLRLRFVAKLRDEKKFASLEDLKAHITQDVARGRAVLDREVSATDNRRGG